MDTEKEYYELKYLINEEKALQIRDVVQTYLMLSEFSACQPNLSYPVHTLYLDSDDLRLYAELTTGYRNRSELRIRYFPINSAAQIYLQIKHWTDACVHKRKANVKPYAVVSLLRGFIPDSTQLISLSANTMAAALEFSRLMLNLSAKPKVHVAYERESYTDDVGHLRVNMDWHIRAECQTDLVIFNGMRNPRACYQHSVMLEVKFIERFQNWLIEMVEDFDLEEYDTSKYGTAMQAVGLVAP